MIHPSASPVAIMRVSPYSRRSSIFSTTGPAQMRVAVMKSKWCLRRLPYSFRGSHSNPAMCAPPGRPPNSARGSCGPSRFAERAMCIYNLHIRGACQATVSPGSPNCAHRWREQLRTSAAMPALRRDGLARTFSSRSSNTMPSDPQQRDVGILARPTSDDMPEHTKTLKRILAREPLLNASTIRQSPRGIGHSGTPCAPTPR